MLKLASVDERLLDGSRKITIDADTKEEVPATGSTTTVIGFSGVIAPYSKIITANLEIAVLDSSDEWKWSD